MEIISTKKDKTRFKPIGVKFDTRHNSKIYIYYIAKDIDVKVGDKILVNVVSEIKITTCCTIEPIVNEETSYKYAMAKINISNYEKVPIYYNKGFSLPKEEKGSYTKYLNKKESKMKNTMNKIIELNKSAAINTSKIEVGKSANKLVLSKIKPHLPMIARGYADTKIAELVIGNIVAGLLTQFAEGNEKAEFLLEAMILAGAQTVIEEFNIPDLINDLLSEVKIPSEES